MQSQDLVSYLQHHIAEQKRYDASLSGIQVPAEISQTQPVTKEAAPVSDATVVLPNDSNKKTRKGTRGLYGNKGGSTYSGSKIPHADQYMIASRRDEIICCLQRRVLRRFNACRGLETKTFLSRNERMILG